MFMRICIICVCIFFIGAGTIAKSEAVLANEYKVATIFSYDINDTLVHKIEKSKYDFLKKNISNVKSRSYYFNYKSNISQHELSLRAIVIKKKIEEFKPDLILIVDSVSFEYYAIPFIYKEKKKNSIFLNLQDHIYEHMYMEYNLKEYSDYIFGTIVVQPFEKLKNAFVECDINTSIIHIFYDSSEHSLIQYNEVKNTFKYSKIIPHRISSTKDLINRLMSINADEPAIIINLLVTIENYDTGKKTTCLELSELYQKHNSEHFELSLNNNISRCGFGTSMITYKSIDLTMSVNEPYNKLILSKYRNQNIEKNILIEHTSLVVNQKRIKALNYVNFINKINNFDYIY